MRGIGAEAEKRGRVLHIPRFFRLTRGSRLSRDSHTTLVIHLTENNPLTRRLTRVFEPEQGKGLTRRFNDLNV